MIDHQIHKNTIGGAIALAIGISVIPQAAIADAVLTFQDNLTPSPTPLPFNAGPIAPGSSANLQFNPSTEFRVVTPYGSNTNDGHKDAMFGGETWTFNNAGQLSAVGNTDPNPGATLQAPITTGVAGFPICPTASSCPTMERTAPFLGNAFNFLAPVLGSVPGNTHGVGTIRIDLTSNTVDTDFPVTHAQYSNGSYIIGNDPTTGCNPASGGDTYVQGQGRKVNLSSPVTNVAVNGGTGAITFDFILHGESIMSRDEVTVPGFCNNAVQWELPGSASVDNQAPVTGNDGPIGVAPSTNIVVDVLANDSDPDHAFLNSTAFDTLTVTGTGVCTNSGTLMVSNGGADVTYSNAATGMDSCSYTVGDGRTGSTNGTVTFNVSSGSQPPTVTDDTFTTDAGTAISFDVLFNDNDANGDAMVVTQVDNPSANGATVTIINGGVEGGDNVMYTPASGFAGTDAFQYTNTAAGDSVMGTVTVTVNPFAESSSGTVTMSSTTTAAAIGVPDDPNIVTTSCVGGCFNVQVSGVASGAQVSILLPQLSTDIPANPVLRHFVTSTGMWEPHDAPDTVQSAAAISANECPGIASGQYGAVTPGHRCVLYTVTDENGTANGPNDDDPTAGIILDPVGFGAGAGGGGGGGRSHLSSSGCSLGNAQSGSWTSAGHWLLVGGLLALFRLLRKRGVST